MKYIFAIALLLAAALHADRVNADGMDFAVGALAGRCDTSVWLTMCDRARLTWHVYLRASKPVTDHLSVVIQVSHFSSFDGSADLTGDTANQSGAFDHVGAGIEWRW